MKIEVEFETACGLIGYKEHKEIITLKDQTLITISSSGKMFSLIVEGNDEGRLDDLIYGIWELCCLYDGYFYKPIKYVIDNVVSPPAQLIRLKFYETDKKWTKPGLMLRRDGAMPLGEEIIEKYIHVRHHGRKCVEGEAIKKLTLPMINSFFYIFSASYSDIILEHRLSLLLNVCDGYAINEGNKQTAKDNINSILVKESVKEIKVFVENRYGISISSFNTMIGETRNELDHYDYKEKSAGNAICSNGADRSLHLFLVYIFNIGFRATLLKKSCDDDFAITETDNAAREAISEIMKWSDEVKQS